MRRDGREAAAGRTGEGESEGAIPAMSFAEWRAVDWYRAFQCRESKRAIGAAAYAASRTRSGDWRIG